jgi:pimeloyl-ACP methyl ester carboxylesterase
MPTIKAGALNINYETFGAGEPLLLIMGFGMPGRAWLPRIPRLGGFKAIIYDNRGTGESDKPDQPVYSIAEMADDASALLRALDIPRIKIERQDGKPGRRRTAADGFFQTARI